jgi:hypothetical protein
MTTETLPTWLSQWRPGCEFKMTDFLASRVVFYPGSGTDGQPVQYFGSRQMAHCFVYIDYGIDREQIAHELSEGGHPFMGYQQLGNFPLTQHELTPHGWQPHIRPPSDAWRHFASAKPFAFIQILERLPQFDVSQGPERLAILFLGADGVATYDAMFCQGSAASPFAAVLQDHGFGGNWTTFGLGGALEELAKITKQWPEYLFVAENTQPWADYEVVENSVAHGGGMHGYSRQLWRRVNPSNAKPKEFPMTHHEEPIFDHDPLGGDVFAPEFDIPGEGFAHSIDEWEQEIDEWAGSEGRKKSPLDDSWNTLPFGSPGDCNDKLFVDIPCEQRIQQLLLDTLNHLRKCANTRLVVFHVGGDIGYLRWMNELIRQLPEMKRLNPNTCFVTRVARSWTPRRTQKPMIWRGAIVNSTNPDYIEVAKCFVDSTHRQKRVILKHRVWLLEELGLLNSNFGYVDLHRNQPSKPPQGSDISFGNRHGQRILDWMSRIYLDDNAYDYPLGFNFLRTPPRPGTDIDKGSETGNNNGWIAKNRRYFLINPYHWISINNLQDPRKPILSSTPHLFNMIPTLKHVASAINLICKNNDSFTPTMVRQLLGRDFQDTEPATLSAQIQPHLSTLRKAGIIEIKSTNQKRNRPHRLINRQQLTEITLNDNYNIRIIFKDDYSDPVDPPVSKDETTNSIIDMERRLMELEEIVDLLQAKLNAIGVVLRS